MRKTVFGIVLSLLVMDVNAALDERLPVNTSVGTEIQAYYDNILDITWSLTYGGIPDDNGLEWAANFSLGGVDDWYLASVNELSHMYNVNGIRSNEPSIFSGSPTCFGRANLHHCLRNGGQFYTRDTVTMMDGYGNLYEAPLRYSFQTDGTFTGGGNYAGWAVTAGDPFATVVPIPPALWLFGSGLLGLIGLARRKA